MIDVVWCCSGVVLTMSVIGGLGQEIVYQSGHGVDRIYIFALQ